MKYIFALILLVSFSACSVMMAATPREAPDTSGLKRGVHRDQIEGILGRPVTYFRRGNGDLATYQFMSNDEASYRRAAAYAVLDGLTLGLAEFFTFGIEAVQGDRHEVEVLYDVSGRAISIREIVHSAPIEKPEKLLGIDEEMVIEEASPAPEMAKLPHQVES